MGHKALQDHAYTFCQMFMGWRMGDDLASFAKLPDGVLCINVLDGTCEHSESGPIETHIACELREWFLQRLAKHQIPRGDIIAATLAVTMKNTIPSPHRRGITLRCLAFSGQSNSLFFSEKDGQSDGQEQAQGDEQTTSLLL